MTRQILIADNHPVTLDTTKKFLEREGFNIIPVKTPREAQLVIKYNRNLAAIILDVRLSDDDDDKDRSGWELAEEASAHAEALAPIIIYSLFSDSHEGMPELSDSSRAGTSAAISFVSKDDGPIALVAKVNEQINLRIGATAQAADSSGLHMKPPIVIFVNQSQTGEQLRTELLKWDIQASVCLSMVELQEAAASLSSALFAIDINMEAKAGAESFEAIRFLKELKRESEKLFYITALAANEALKLMALQAGADMVLLKISVEIDALELITRISQHKIEIEKVAAEKPQTQLAIRHYEALRKQLTGIRESSERNLPMSIGAVQRALSWPFLFPEEKLVLTSLYMQMRANEGVKADTQIIDLCIQGTEMLAEKRARGANVAEWIERARRHSANFTLAWLDEDYFDDEKEEDDD